MVRPDFGSWADVAGASAVGAAFSTGDGVLAGADAGGADAAGADVVVSTADAGAAVVVVGAALVGVVVC